MTIITKGMGAVIKNILKPRGRKISKLEKQFISKGVVDRNTSSKEIFKIAKGLKK